MEAPEEVIIMGSKEQPTHIAKGKRTKRQRPQSPISFPITTNSSSGDGSGGEYEDHNTNFSPTTSTEILGTSTDQEEEDMANCLILLAQGQSRLSPKQEDTTVGVNYKYNSRRFLEAAATGNAKAGYYVYECKTCNRTFPSFQALGGHRASHKKTKAAEEKKQQFMFMSDDEEISQFKNKNEISSLSLQLSSRGLYNSSNNRPKVHECSICGSEFTSGQALGGHMRRHRAPMGTNTTLSLTPVTLEPEEPIKPRHVVSLDLDLNLPAPEDDHREPKFPFEIKQQKQQQQQQQQQQTSLVFSAPTLVGCHY